MNSILDKALDLDMLLIQLKPQVVTKWKQFAEAVGLSNIIKELSQYSEDECIVEVFDQWLKSHPTKPTWRNVADVLNDIGLQQLAKDIRKVYQTGIYNKHLTARYKTVWDDSILYVCINLEGTEAMCYNMRILSNLCEGSQYSAT